MCEWRKGGFFCILGFDVGVGLDLDIEGKEEPSNRFWWDCCNLVEVFFIRLVPLVGSPSGVFCILVVDLIV